MEHLVLPIDPLESDLKIPFVAVEYDGGPFLTYPARRGMIWPLSYDPEGPLSPGLYPLLPSMSTTEQESFFQTWLFFGLLQVFMKEEFKAEHYKWSEGDQTHITTARLFGNMQEVWIKQVRQGTKDKTVQFIAILRCLGLVAHVLREANEDFDWRIKLSIATLCELFSSTVVVAYKSLGVEQPAPNNARELGLHLFEEDRKARMLSAGWCSNDIAIAAERFSSVQMLYFLSRMKKLDLKRDHRGCQDDMCKWNQIKKDEYQTLHVQQPCHCPDKSTALCELELCLSRHRLPLLRLKNIYGDPPDLEIEVVEYSGKEKYVAISHVWAYGLGNPSANSLPRCQVARLGDLISRLRSTVMYKGKHDVDGELQIMDDNLHSSLKPDIDEEIYLWIDTLCCPVSPAESKALAFELLEYTYREASYVLVLDGGLVVCNYASIPVYEAIARIFTSAWLQRVWTLQEGVLAQDRLWFQFKDRTVNLKALMYTRFEHNIALLSFVNDIVLQYQTMCMSFLQDERLQEVTSSHTAIGKDLLALDRALRHRSITVESDEALCICTLLRLPTKVVARLPAEVEARMSQVWRLIAQKYGGIPQRVLYLSFPRLQTRGFRWAPRTLLKESDGRLFKLFTSTTRGYMWHDPRLGDLTESGLVVKWPGFELKPKNFHNLSVKSPWGGALPRLEETRVLFKSEDGTRYQFSSKEHTRYPSYKHAKGSFPLHEIIQRGCCHIILADDGQFVEGFTKGMGILGNVTSSSNEGHVLNFEAAEQVLEFKTSEQEGLILDTAERVAYQLELEPLAAKLATMDTEAGNEEYETRIDIFKKRLEEVCAEEAKNQLLTNAFKKVYNITVVDRSLRVLVQDCFYHDIVGKSLSAEQQWCVG